MIDNDDTLFNKRLYDIAVENGYRGTVTDFLSTSNASAPSLFAVDKHAIDKIRFVLAGSLFRREDFICNFVKKLSQSLPMLKYEYDPAQLTYTIRLKKTAVKKLPNYNASASYYYNIVADVVHGILSEYKSAILESLVVPVVCYKDINASTPIIVVNTYYELINVPAYSYHLFNVQIISDNIIQIVL